MEFLNRVNLVGIIGQVRVSELGNTKYARVSLATNSAFKKDGSLVIETTWHNLTIFQSEKTCDLSLLEKGKALQVVGRIRNQRYTGADGSEHYLCEIIVSECSLIEGQLAMETSGL